MPKIPVRWNDHFPSYHLSFPVFFRFFFHGIHCGTLKNKGAIQTIFLLCISSWFYSLLNWNLLILSLVLVEALMRDFFRSNVYLTWAWDSYFPFVCISRSIRIELLVQEKELWSISVIPVIQLGFFLSYHLLSALISLVPITKQMPDKL